MPYKIVKVKNQPKYKLYNIEKKKFVQNKTFNSKETAEKTAQNYIRYEKYYNYK
tara:strand:+ start:204 stop:365 length:162 start_codon:yes stop_codon:yes gene_type:complete